VTVGWMHALFFNEKGRKRKGRIREGEGGRGGKG
jgi:hypothetical protein